MGFNALPDGGSGPAVDTPLADKVMANRPISPINAQVDFFMDYSFAP